MKVEIWSDVMCPFCYIGKRRFEKALEQFPQKEKVEVEWKSFQLNPAMKTDPTKNINQYLSEAKGWTIDYAKKVNESVTARAKEVGLIYNFDKAIVANSFDAHRFSHLAKQHGLQDKAEEKLFAAYFTEGKNTADHNTLIQLGIDIGLNADEIKQMLNSNLFADDVRRDIYDAQQVGVQGVPFFVIDNRYAVSGAQESDLFLQALNAAWKESAKENPLLEIADGEVCTPESC